MGMVLAPHCTLFCTGKSLRRGFCKDRPWLGTIAKRFSDFAEIVHIGVIWAETTENEVRKFLKKFRRKIWREI
jgi:hypothetical protein